MIKTSQDSDVIDRKGLDYIGMKIKLTRSIWSSVVCDENQTGQWCNRLYKCDLRRKRNRAMMID